VVWTTLIMYTTGIDGVIWTGLVMDLENRMDHMDWINNRSHRNRMGWYGLD
jgi:hypothetical protein